MTFCPTITLEEYEQGVQYLEGLFDGMQSHTEEMPANKEKRRCWGNSDFAGASKKKNPAEAVVLPKHTAPPVPAELRPPVTALQVGKKLTTLQHSFLSHVCEFKDKGNQPQIADIAEAMHLNDGQSLPIIKTLVKKGCLKTDRIHLIPLLRPDGRKYASLTKINGITVCEPAFARGYVTL